MVITIDAVTKEPRVFQGQQQWGVKLVNGEWITLVCNFRPSKGQQFDVNINERAGTGDYAGKIFKTATIIAPAPREQPQPQAGVQFPSAPKQLATVQPPPLNAKIPWEDWEVMIRACWETAIHAGMPPAEAVAVVSTTLIAFSNGKLETPIESGPVSNGEPGTDDDDVPEFMK